MNLLDFPKVNILIVDDRPENVLALEAAFKDSGYDLYTAFSGKEALEHARHREFACVLMDVQMPILDGFETAQALRQLPRTEITPIIFVTAIHRSHDYEQLGYVAGAVDFLFKPINTDILKAKVTVFVDLFLKREEIKRKNTLLENAIQQSKENIELKRALKSRDEFLMMASHELKTPITPLGLQMQMFLQLFETGTYQTVEPERLLRMIRTSNSQIERLSKLIYELIDVSKISTQRLELSREETNLSFLVEKILLEYEASIRDAGSSLQTKIEPGIIGHWDAFRLEQVIVNLLNNALKYGEGKPIHISVGRTENKEAFFKIRDEGIGIELNDQERIFDRYERAVSARSYSGLGLGLYISRQIIELHKGQIRVQSRLHEGSEFVVTLPG